MYMKSLIPVTAALLLLAACGQRNASRQTAPAAAQTAAPDMHDAENALDYQGAYTGVFPAADVPGIAVTLTLGPDGRYTEVNRYCERPGQFTDYGRYTVRGNILTLRPDSPKDIPAYYRVGENRLWRLDSHQQPITGPFADQYILTKSDSAAHGRSRHRGRRSDRGNQKTSRTGFVQEVERNGTEAPFRRMRCYYLLL